MTTRFTLMERLVGIFILLAFLSVLVTIVLVGRGQNWFREHNEYYAIYKEGYNLQPGVKVKLLRTDIGQVTEVTLTETNHVKVAMRILETYASRIRGDSKAAIESPTFIGSEYINIIPGSYKTEMIPPGGQIPSKEQKKIAEYLEEVEFEHKLLMVNEILENLARITDQLDDQDGPLFGTMENLRQLTGHVAEGKGTIGKVVKDDEIYKRLLAELETLDKILASVRGTMDTIKSTARSAQSVAGGVSKKTPDMMTQVGDILARLQTISLQLEKAMNEVPDISRQARQGMRDVNKILEAVKKNFLIRGNLPGPTTPQSHGVEMRGD